MNCTSLLAICAGGLENEVLQDILSNLHRLDADAKVFCDELIKKFEGGQILVETTADINTVLQIRSVQIWLIHIVSILDLDKNKLNGLHQVSEAASNGSWISALNTWDTLRPEKSRGSISFCARCLRDGSHEFNSMDVARTIGDVLATKFNWKVNLTEPDVEVVAFVSNTSLSIGLNVFCPERSFKNNRVPPENRPPAVTSQSLGSLRSSTVYTLLTMLRPKEGEVLVDYLCGVGGTLVEAVYAYGVIGLGGDGEEAYRRNMLANSASLNSLCPCSVSDDRAKAVIPAAEFILWTITRLPLRTASVDLFLANLPSGKCKRSCRHSRASLHKVVAEMARVLSCGGRALILCESGQQLRVCLDSEYFEGVAARTLRLGGHVCVVILATRSAKPFRPLTEFREVAKIRTASIDVIQDSKRQRVDS